MVKYKERLYGLSFWQEEKENMEIFDVIDQLEDLIENSFTGPIFH